MHQKPAWLHAPDKQCGNFTDCGAGMLLFAGGLYDFFCGGLYPAALLCTGAGGSRRGVLSVSSDVFTVLPFYTEGRAVRDTDAYLLRTPDSVCGAACHGSHRYSGIRHFRRMRYDCILHAAFHFPEFHGVRRYRCRRSHGKTAYGD